ncbi:MAG: hypothetical protein M1822_003906 [Bathelium mastoideum]|nr:MAG: hypothetical protein M1822_003906 [Bathelium mastoideum]
MASHTFAAFIDVDQRSEIKDPPAAHHPVSSINSPSALELDELTWGSAYNGPSSHQGSQSHPQTPKTPNELESSRPPSPEHEEAHAVQSWSSPSMNKWRVLAACIEYFGNGLNDAAPGALIPYLERDYRIGYAVVSLIFVTNAIGFISAAFITDFLTSRFGRAKSLMFAEALVLSGYVMVVCTPPFPVVVVAFLLLGLGMALTLALNNVFLANLTQSTVMLGLGHGSYGIGGTVAPIIATTMVSHGIVWSRFYFIAIGIRLAAFFLTGWAYRAYEQQAGIQLMSPLEQTASRRAAQQAGSPGKRQLLMKALKQKTTLFGALFIFAYQGAEVSISGWVISFLINYRGGDPAHVGYVTAGFWVSFDLAKMIR